MALVVCPDCQTEVSDRAATCVKCGRPLRYRSGLLRSWRVQIGVIVFLLCVGVIGLRWGLGIWHRGASSESPQEFDEYSSKMKSAMELALGAFREGSRLAPQIAGSRHDPVWRDQWMAAMTQLRLAGGAFLSLRGPHGFEAVDEGFHDAGRELEAAARDGEVAILADDDEAGRRAGRRLGTMASRMADLQTRLIAATVSRYGTKR